MYEGAGETETETTPHISFHIFLFLLFLFFIKVQQQQRHSLFIRALLVFFFFLDFRSLKQKSCFACGNNCCYFYCCYGLFSFIYRILLN